LNLLNAQEVLESDTTLRYLSFSASCFGSKIHHQTLLKKIQGRWRNACWWTDEVAHVAFEYKQWSAVFVCSTASVFNITQHNKINQ